MYLLHAYILTHLIVYMSIYVFVFSFFIHKGMIRCINTYSHTWCACVYTYIHINIHIYIEGLRVCKSNSLRTPGIPYVPYMF